MSHEKLKLALSSALANKATDSQITEIFDSLVNQEKPVIGFDPCIYGICVNYGLEGKPPRIELDDWVIDGLGEIQETDILIDGIVLPERTTLKVRYNF